MIKIQRFIDVSRICLKNITEWTLKSSTLYTPVLIRTVILTSKRTSLARLHHPKIVTKYTNDKTSWSKYLSVMLSLFNMNVATDQSM